MPRDLKSGDDNRLTMTAIVDCPECGGSWDQVFVADAQQIEDMQEPPTAHCKCEECAHEFDTEYPGFAQYGYS